jgi:trk system potassium uptake protein TrkA
MKCAVLGIGRFGGTVARHLAKGDSEVIAIDKQLRLVEAIKDEVTVAVRLDATSEEELRAQGIDSVDVAVVGIGDDFEATVLTIALLKKIGVGKIVARAGSELQKRILQLLGADEIIFPEEEAARNLAQHILRPNLVDYFKLSGAFTVAEIKAPPEFIGKTLKDLDLRKKYGISVIGVKQRPVSESIPKDGQEGIPNPDDRIRIGDELVVIGSDTDMAKFLENMQPE